MWERKNGEVSRKRIEVPSNVVERYRRVDFMDGEIAEKRMGGIWIDLHGLEQWNQSIRGRVQGY